MSKILIAYYSKTGYTKQLAEMLAAAMHADLEPIREAKVYAGFWGYLRAGRDAWRHRAAEIQPTIKDPDSYDLVILGSPVWAGQMSSPMRAYIEQQKQRFNRIAVFCTQGGRGGENVMKQMAELAGGEPVAGLVINDDEMTSGSHAAKVDAFVSKVMKALAGRPMVAANENNPPVKASSASG